MGSERQQDERFVGVLRWAGAIALGAGAGGSAGFTFYAGQRVGAPRLLMGLFALWVGSPFVALAIGYLVSTRWSVLTRVFVIVAPLSWLFMAIVAAAAAFVSRQRSFRRTLPRVYALKDMLVDPSNPNAYFQDFEDGLEHSASKLNAFLKLERWLAVLDVEAWNDLRKGCHASRVVHGDHGRGWQALFDVLSEARGFGYLRSIDCSGVHFIKRSEGKKTPDLGAVLAGGQVFCEVKTINISQGEVERRRSLTNGAVGDSSTSLHVAENFLRKLSATLGHAIEQLDGVDPERRARRLVLVVVHVDDWVGDHQSEYFAQIDEHLLRRSRTGVLPSE